MNIEEVLKKYKESGIYEGKNIEGEEIILFREKNNGCILKRLQPNGWYQCLEYDENGFLDGEYYEKERN